jgi:hypothetical protein
MNNIFYNFAIMQQENTTKDFNGMILVIVLFFLFVCSFTNSYNYHSTAKAQVESLSADQQNHPALVSANHVLDSKDIFISVIKKYPSRTINVFKALNLNRLTTQKFSILRKIEYSSAPSPTLGFSFQYQYHSQKADDFPAIG